MTEKAELPEGLYLTNLDTGSAVDLETKGSRKNNFTVAG
jgi:hypothetical protein